MLDFNQIAHKWQQRWEKENAFHAEVNDKKKFYVAIVYPYMSGLLHLGHLFTYTFSEVAMRYKRMRGFNVLAKYGYHCTGTPIIAAAQRVKEGEAVQIENLKKMGIAESEIKKFSNPEYWCEYFPKETLKDAKGMGFSIDDRYAFKTTYLNPPYDAFIRWQFNKLKQAGYVKQGKHPVVWCPKDNVPVGDHDRAEGEGETPKNFIWAKFRMKDSDQILMAGTTRPDALLAQTHIWIDPDGTYCLVEVKTEKWIVSKEAVKKIEQQYGQAKIIKEIHAKELTGKWTRGPLVDYDTYIVPAGFIDPKIGSGIVYSALEDPVDLIEIQHLQAHSELVKKYHLDPETIRKLKPISIIKIPEMGDDLGQEMIEKYGIKSPSEKQKLEEAKGELNRSVYRKGTMKDHCGKYAGMTIPEAQTAINKDLIESGEAAMFYEMTGKVICRCLTECVIKMVTDQWFIEYNDPEWKKKTHEALDHMEIYPEVVRKQFDYVIDWLDHWACTREYGLGTKLPWDHKWVIESLSDSTIQMAYGTVSKYLQNPDEYGIKVEGLTDELFDFVFLGKGDVLKISKDTQIPKKTIEILRRDFEYWYPFDFRNSAKDLVQNHLTFTLFNHVAIFPKKHWPKAYAINGRIMVNNEKMSKSKGNFFTMRELYTKHGADIVRLTAANAGEGVDDANYDMDFLETAKKKLTEHYELMKEHHGKGRSNELIIDQWLESKINENILNATEAMENMMFKTAIFHMLLEMQRNMKWYMKRSGNSPNKHLMHLYFESTAKMLAPFTPHFAEECWEEMGKKGFISHADWPLASKKAINPQLDSSEELISNTISDIRAVMKLANISQPKNATIILSPEWKHDLFSHIEKTKDITIKEVLSESRFKPHGEEITRFLPKMISSRKFPRSRLDKKQEIEALEEAKEFIEKEIGLKIILEDASSSKEQKAKNAMPGKPAIVIF